MRKLIVCCCLYCCALSAIAAQGDDEPWVVFKHRFLLALRNPEALTNVGDLVPLEEYLRDSLVEVKLPGTWRLFGYEVRSKTGLRAFLAKVLSEDLILLRRLLSDLDVDVTKDPQEFKILEVERSPVLVVRFSSVTVFVALGRIDSGERIYAYSLGRMGAVQIRDRLAKCLHFKVPADANSRPKSSEFLFESRLTTGDLEKSEDHWGIWSGFYLAVQGNPEFIGKVEAEVEANRKSVVLPLDSRFCLLFDKRVRERAKLQWKILSVECRRVGEE